MVRWKLQESKLPPDTAVLFKEPTIWTEYRGPVNAAILIVQGDRVKRFVTKG